MNSIPLIKGNTPQEINTSIIALKKALSELEAQNRLLQGTDRDVQDKIKQINELIEGINTHLGTVDSHLTVIDKQITALQPVDTVTSGNMHSVTSNAVAQSFVSKIGYQQSYNADLMTAFANVGLIDSWYTRTAKYFCDNIASYENGIHSISIGGPAYGIILWKWGDTYYSFDIVSYADYIAEKIKVVRVGENYYVCRYAPPC